MMRGRLRPTASPRHWLGLIVSLMLGLLVVGLVLRHDRASLVHADAVVEVSPFQQAYHATVLPLLTQYCYDCHGDGASAGDLELDAYESADELAEGHQVWEKVITYIRTQTMPPPDADGYPTQAERDTLADALERIVYRIDPSRPDPGRVTIRRLNRTEYRNTMRDLLGVSFDPTIDFPEDDTGYGFDNIADVLTLPPMLMEKYLAAAETLLDEAIPTEVETIHERRIAAEQAEASSSLEKHDGWVALSSREEDSLSVRIERSTAGDFTVRVLAYAERTEPAEQSPAPITLSFMLGDVVVREVEVSADAGDPQWYEARVGVPAGKHSIRLALRRQRGMAHDRVVLEKRVGPEQSGRVHVKEIVLDGPLDGAVRRFAAGELKTTGSAQRHGDSVLLSSRGEAAVSYAAHSPGPFLIRVQASADHAGDEPARLELLVDGEPIGELAVAAPNAYRNPEGVELAKDAGRAVPKVYEVQAELKPGRRTVAVSFINDAYHPDHEHPNFRDRNVLVQGIELVDLSSPPLPRPMSEPMRKLFVQHAGPAAGVGNAPIEPQREIAQAILSNFALRAWRRPPQEQELERITRLYDFAREHGESFHASVKHAMKAVLVSSSFLFRAPPPAAGAPDALAAAQPVDEFELAARLSYFLWSSTPDNELLELAAENKLRANLRPQVQRMIASKKSAALIENFAGQWLQFRNLDAVHPDRNLFEHYDDALREAMKKETQLLFDAIMREDRSLLEVLTADYTFVNERLAKHYGLADVKGEQFRRVSLEGTPRRGVMTHGSVLTLTSNPTRTSPVKRGKWVLENLLGTEPPPPPPDIPSLEQPEQALTGSNRQRLEQHRADPTCASCHAPMDPIGFALENFDAIGAWREKDGDEPVDAKSAFVDGDEFEGAVELVELLVERRRGDYYRSLARNLLTFALGRGVEPHDQPAVEKIVRRLHETDAKFSELVYAVVESVPFQMRRVADDFAVMSGQGSADAALLATGNRPLATDHWRLVRGSEE